MPFEVMDQRGISDPTNFFDEKSFHSERNVGLRKQIYMNDQHPQGMNGTSVAPDGSIFSASSPFTPNTKSELMKGSKESLHYNPQSWSDVFMQSAPTSAPTSYHLVGNKVVATDALPHESSLYSGSLSDMFSKQLNLLGNDLLSDQPTAAGSLLGGDPYKTFEEMEADAIHNLLPDEDDLFSGVADELENNSHARTNDDFEDFDLFSSGGGLELEGHEHLSSLKRTSGLNGDHNYFGGSKGKIPIVEQPSRTLFVRNINSSVEDDELKTLFEQYGEIRHIYTACKHRGFVMITYHDLRAAQKAMQALQSRPLRTRKLDIHYSLPKDNAPEKDIGYATLMLTGLDSSILNDELKHIFGFYGEIKEIYEYPEIKHHKFIEFYDVRAAEEALRALNRMEIGGKQIKLEPIHPSLMQQSHKVQDERDRGHNITGNLQLRQKSTVTSGVIDSFALENGYNQRFQSSMQQQPMNGFVDNAFFHVNSSTNNSLRGASVGKVSGVSESINLVDAMKFASNPTTFHPHSLPEFHGSLANGSPYNFSTSIPNNAGNIGTAVTEASNGRHIQGISSVRNLAEFNGGGSLGNGIHTHPGASHMWNGSNLHQQASPNNMLWQKTASFGNNAQGLPQMSSFARTPQHMLRTQQMDHHVGSAPVVTASPWERKISYLGESPNASGFHLGSPGNGAFHGSWQMRPMTCSPHNNMFSHVGGNGAELSSSAGQNSPDLLSHAFYGRQHPKTTMSKFDPVYEQMINLYSRKSEANTTNNADKKQYELDLGRILLGEDSRTTLMIKNIPNKYTSKMLLVAIDEECRGTYDFLYLPIDFKNKCNVGYAFINMTDPMQIISFYKHFQGKKWEKFNSEKVASLAYARIQGRASLVAHFQNSSLMNEDKRCRPILFQTEGPNAGDMEPFPVGANVRVRPGKSRNAHNEESRIQAPPSTSSTGDESSTNGTDSSRNSD